MHSIIQYGNGRVKLWNDRINYSTEVEAVSAMSEIAASEYGDDDEFCWEKKRRDLSLFFVDEELVSSCPGVLPAEGREVVRYVDGFVWDGRCPEEPYGFAVILTSALELDKDSTLESYEQSYM